MSLLDFSGPLAIAANHCPKIRFSVFSDCAFITTSTKHASDLIAAIRFAFIEWFADGILVRGGIARSGYIETRSFARVLGMPSKNFIGSLFSSSAVTAAMKLEGSGCGALLFINDETAEFLHREYEDPIYTVESYKVVGSCYQLYKIKAF